MAWGRGRYGAALLVVLAAPAGVLWACGGGDAPPGRPAPDAAADAAGDAPGPDGAPLDAPVDRAPPACGAPSLAAVDAATAALAPEYASAYRAYVLGAPPALPPGAFAASAISPTFPETLVLGVDDADGGGGEVWLAPLARDACGHVVGFDAGGQSKTHIVEHVRAAAYGPSDVYFAVLDTSDHTMIEVPPGPSLNASLFGLLELGFEVDAGDEAGVAGLAFAPRAAPDAGRARVLSTAGNWYQVSYAGDGGASDGGPYPVTGVAMTRALPRRALGAAYVPRGSPAFASQALLVAGDDARVYAYDVDAAGDPVLASERPFFAQLRGLVPGGMTVDPASGDLLLAARDVGAPGALGFYVVRGFVAPPGG